MLCLPVRKGHNFFFQSLLCWLINDNLWLSHFVAQKAVISRYCPQKNIQTVPAIQGPLLSGPGDLFSHISYYLPLPWKLSQPNQTVGCSPASVFGASSLFFSLSISQECLFLHLLNVPHIFQGVIHFLSWGLSHRLTLSTFLFSPLS